MNCHGFKWYPRSKNFMGIDVNKVRKTCNVNNAAVVTDSIETKVEDG